MSIFQKSIVLPPFARGFHLITDTIEREIESCLPTIATGILHVFVQHTSASLTINENADPSVRQDFESHINEMIPENAPYYVHTYEGPDDMPAHIKASVFGSSVSVPITDGQLNLGTWQGIYFGEHRDYGGSRKLVISVYY